MLFGKTNNPFPKDSKSHLISRRNKKLLLSLILTVVLFSSFAISNTFASPFLKVQADAQCGSTALTFNDTPTTGSPTITFNGTNYSNGQGLSWTGQIVGCDAPLTANPPPNEIFANWTIFTTNPTATIIVTDLFSWNTTITVSCGYHQQCQAAITANYIPSGNYCNSNYPGCITPQEINGNTIRFLRIRAFQTDNACLPGQKGPYTCDSGTQADIGGCDAFTGSSFFYQYWAACSTVQNITWTMTNGYPAACTSNHPCFTIYPADDVVDAINQAQPTYLERFLSGDWYNYLDQLNVPCIYSISGDPSFQPLPNCVPAGSPNNCPTLTNQEGNGLMLKVVINGCMKLKYFLVDVLKSSGCTNLGGSGKGCEIIPRVDLVCYEDPSNNNNCFQGIGYIDASSNPPQTACSVKQTQFNDEIAGIEEAYKNDADWPVNQPIQFISIDNWGPTMEYCYQDTPAQYHSKVNSLFSNMYDILKGDNSQYGVGVNIQTCTDKYSISRWALCSTQNEGSGGSGNAWATWAAIPVSHASSNGGNNQPCNNSPWSVQTGPISGEHHNGIQTLILYIDSPIPLEYFVCQSDQAQYMGYSVLQENAWSTFATCQFATGGCSNNGYGEYWLVYEAFQFAGTNLIPISFLHSGYDWTDQGMAIYEGNNQFGNYQSTNELNDMSSCNSYSHTGCQ